MKLPITCTCCVNHVYGYVKIVFKVNITDNREDVDKNDAKDGGKYNGSPVPCDRSDDIEKCLLLISDIKELECNQTGSQKIYSMSLCWAPSHQVLPTFPASSSLTRESSILSSTFSELTFIFQKHVEYANFCDVRWVFGNRKLNFVLEISHF